ncbi:MAG: hypothetical protein ACRDSZ_01185 [Pseudonocardiaceae bacterium]
MESRACRTQRPPLHPGEPRRRTLDVCEAAAHEFAETWLRAGCRRPSLAHLPLRRYIADPFDPLGNSEHDGNSPEPIDYDHDEPFRTFAAVRDAGDFRVFATAVVLEPLTLWVELLTVAVIEACPFGRLFSFSGMPGSTATRCWHAEGRARSGHWGNGVPRTCSDGCVGASWPRTRGTQPGRSAATP